MELSWSTFVLEIINFLILIWILNRFLFGPVMKIINQRRAGIEKEMDDAKGLRQEAETLRKQYEHRLSDWEIEQRKSRDNLDQELEQVRAKKLAQIDSELQQEREKSEVISQRHLQEATRRIEEVALSQAAQFASNLLGQAAGPEVETRLIDLALQELAALPENRINELRAMWTEAPAEIGVDSVYALSSSRQQQLQQTLHELTGLDVPVRFNRNAELIAGLQITIGPWVLRLNLRDELQSFAELAHD